MVKKQKKNAGVEYSVQKKKAQAKTLPPPKDSSSSESDSESEEEKKVYLVNLSAISCYLFAT